MLLLAAAVLALQPGPCSAKTARAEILRQNVQIGALTHGRIPVAPDQADRVICADFTRDGRMDMAVTIASGGTAGDIAWIVFVRTPVRWRLVLNRSGYKLGLYRLGGDLADSQPVYLKAIRTAARRAASTTRAGTGTARASSSRAAGTT